MLPLEKFGLAAWATVPSRPFALLTPAMRSVPEERSLHGPDTSKLLPGVELDSHSGFVNARASKNVIHYLHLKVYCVCRAHKRSSGCERKREM